MVPSLCTVIKGKCLSECQILNRVSNFEQRFLRDEKVSAKTLETSSRHRSENSESGRIFDNSEKSTRYLNFTEHAQGGYPPKRVCQRLRTRPLIRLNIWQAFLIGTTWDSPWGYFHLLYGLLRRIHLHNYTWILLVYVTRSVQVVYKSFKMCTSLF